MRATSALCLILLSTAGAIGTTKRESEIKKNGNIYISDCYLSAIKPGEVRTQTLSYRNTDPKAPTEPVNQNLYVRDSTTDVIPPQPDQGHRHGQTFYNNINRYNITIQNVFVKDGCEADDCVPTLRTRRIIEIRPTEEFTNIPQGTIPAYTIMGEKWDISLLHCHPTSAQDIYLIGDLGVVMLPKHMTVIDTRSYKVTIENTNDYGHCVIADAPCLPFEKRTIEITATE